MPLVHMMAAGLGWHGLGEVWRETLVSRPGESYRVPVRVPAERPVLDLAMGTPEDVAGDHPEVVTRLAETLAAWRSWVEAHKLPQDSAEDLSSEDLERLRSLGYL